MQDKRSIFTVSKTRETGTKYEQFLKKGQKSNFSLKKFVKAMKKSVIVHCKFYHFFCGSY